jgi:hypothetical protein
MTCAKRRVRLQRHSDTDNETEFSLRRSGLGLLSAVGSSARTMNAHQQTLPNPNVGGAETMASVLVLPPARDQQPRGGDDVDSMAADGTSLAPPSKASPGT